MTQTSTVVHSINSAPQKSAGEPRKTAKNLAVPLALLSALAVNGRADDAGAITRRRVARLSRLAKNPTPSAWTEFPATYDASRV